jgi:hypothetical protein
VGCCLICSEKTILGAHVEFSSCSIVKKISDKRVHKVNHLEASHGLFGTLELQQSPTINYSHPNNCCVNYSMPKNLTSSVFAPRVSMMVRILVPPPAMVRILFTTSCLLCNPHADVKGFGLLGSHRWKIMCMVLEEWKPKKKIINRKGLDTRIILSVPRDHFAGL